MKQQNLEKRQQAIKFFTFMSAVGCIVYIFCVPEQQKDLVYSNIYSTIPTICLIIWLLFDKWMWRMFPIHPLLQWFSKRTNSILSSPVLDGRWEGYFMRDYEEDKKIMHGEVERDCKEIHPFVLEISQTFSSITCQTFSTHSRSISNLSEVLFNEGTNTHCIHFHWNCIQNNTPLHKNPFEGYTTLDLVLTAPFQLKGKYFTDRDPQTKGEIFLCKVERAKHNSFEPGVQEEVLKILGVKNGN